MFRKIRLLKNSHPFGLPGREVAIAQNQAQQLVNLGKAEFIDLDEPEPKPVPKPKLAITKPVRKKTVRKSPAKRRAKK